MFDISSIEELHQPVETYHPSYPQFICSCGAYRTVINEDGWTVTCPQEYPCKTIRRLRALVADDSYWKLPLTISGGSLTSIDDTTHYTINSPLVSQGENSAGGTNESDNV